MMNCLFFLSISIFIFAIQLYAGNTFFIPTGWIHAVYTPSDSLVFGGNFLHPFGIEKQLKIAQVEDSTKVSAFFQFTIYIRYIYFLHILYLQIIVGSSKVSVSILH